MKLCAPVKQLTSTNKVELLELDEGSHKTLYESGTPRYIDIDWKTKTLPKEAAFINSSQGSGERSKARSERSGPHDEPIAKGAMGEEEDRSGKAAAGRIHDEFMKAAPKGNVIVSYHNFEETPDLEAVLKTLKQAHPQAHFYKIATQARSTLDSLRMLTFLMRHPNIIGLCMGELGSVTRICAPIFGGPLTYAPLREEEKNAPGQLLVDQLCHIYHFRSLNPATEIFGLIGDPVSQSIGHLFHNDVFRTQKRNAVYVKMVVKPDELSEFFGLVKQLPFAGLSVTAPLKEAVVPYVDVLHPYAKAIGAVNTLAFREGQIWGYNTDGDAALDVLGDVRNKTMVVLGAGGAARAVIYTALQRGAHVVVVNRTTAKAQEIAKTFGCSWSERVPKHDILINATSSSIPNDIQLGATVMDIGLGRGKGGYQMYFQQALAQQAIWASTKT